MAKFGLIFLVIFVLIQLTMAASRPVRDVEEAAKTDDPMKTLTALFDQAKAAVEGALTKENLDKLTANGKDVLQTVSEHASKVYAAVQERLAEPKPAE